jgi:hypothetical protein
MSKEVFGLREKIAKATSEQEIVKLLKLGNSYEFASARTRASWKNTGFRVLENLKNTESSTKETTEVKPKSKKQKK